MNAKKFRDTDNDWTPFKSLHGVVRLVLLVDWDPIGILGYLRPLDEYDSYAADVTDLLLSGASRQQLIAHLDSIEKKQMSGRGERPAQAEVADKLLLIYKTNTEYERWRTEN